MTNPQSEDLVSVSFSMPKAAVIRPPTEVLDPAPGWQFITDASTGYHHHLPTPEWLQEQADRIQQLEREKAERELELLRLVEKVSADARDANTEADTLARAFQIAHVIIGGRATPREQEFLDEVLTIAERRVNGE